MKMRLSDKNIAIITLVVTVYFGITDIIVPFTVYRLQKQDEPRYQIAYHLSGPLPVNSGEAFKSDNNLTNSHVHKVEMVIWNSGTETIPYDQIIEPIKIR